jgi:hypothetical protein
VIPYPQFWTIERERKESFSQTLKWMTETNPIGETEIETPNVTATATTSPIGVVTIPMTTAIIDLTGLPNTNTKPGTEKIEKEAEIGIGYTTGKKERVAKVGLN